MTNDVAEASPEHTPFRASARKWVALTALLGYILFLVYLIFFVDLGSLASEIAKINLAIYALAITSLILSIVFHSAVWYQLLKYLQIKVSFRKTFNLYWVGVFVDSIIPGSWSGDLTKAYLLSRDARVNGGEAVASVVVKNIYEALFNLGTMILGLALLLLNYELANTILSTVVIVILILILPLITLLIVSFKPEGTKKLVRRLITFISRVSRGRWKLAKYQTQVDKTVDGFHAGIKTLITSPKVLTQPLLLSLLALIFEILTLFLVFISLGNLVSIDKVLIVRSIAGNLEFQGYAFTGYAQIITATLYATLGVPTAVGASVALLGGAVLFWLRTGISYVAFHCEFFASCSSIIYGSKRKNKGAPKTFDITVEGAKEPPQT